MSRLHVFHISLICVFISRFISRTDSNDNFYTKIELENPVTMNYSVSFKDVSLTTCGMKCTLYTGCKLFHHDVDNTCYILNMVDKGIGVINIASLHVDQYLKERCSNHSVYLSYFGGIFCMKAFSDRLNWLTAKTRCEQDGGNLLIMKQTELALKMEGIKMLRSSIYWVGMNDIDIEGKMVWVDGSTPDINIWRPNEPNDAGEGEDCVIFGLQSYRLNDQPCSVTFNFICEFPFMFIF